MVGLLLVLGSVVLGTRVVAAADESVLVWAAAADLPAGTTLTSADIRLVGVRLDDGVDRYVGTAGESPAGRTLAAPISAGELLPVSALAQAAVNQRLVTLPVDALHLPPGLGRGEQVDIYVTPQPEEGGDPALVLPAAVVSDVVAEAGFAAGQTAVVVEVDAADAGVVVGAVRSGDVDVVRLAGSS